MCSSDAVGVGVALAAASTPGAPAIAALTAVPLGGLTREELCDLYAAVRTQSNWLAAIGNQLLRALADRSSAEVAGTDLDPGVPAGLAGLVDELGGRIDARWQRLQLAAAARLSPYEARTVLETALRLRDRLPAAAAALGAGRISQQHATTLARETARLTPHDATRVDAAITSDPSAVSVTQWRERARTLTAALLPAAIDTDAHTIRDQRALRAWHAADGTGHLHGQFTPEDLTAITHAIHTAATPWGPSDPRTADQRRADALLELLTTHPGLTEPDNPNDHDSDQDDPDQDDPDEESGEDGGASGDHEESGEDGGAGGSDHRTDGDEVAQGASEQVGAYPNAMARADRRRGHKPGRNPGKKSGRKARSGQPNSPFRAAIVIHVPAGMFSADPTCLDRAPTINGRPIDGATFRTLTCDTILWRALTAAATGTPIDTDYHQRLPSPRLRRALEIHHHGRCAFPGCNRRKGLIPHHIIHWIDGGLTVFINLVPLCPMHHSATHHGQYNITRHQNGTLQFRTPTGRLINPPPPAWQPPPEPPWPLPPTQTDPDADANSAPTNERPPHNPDDDPPPF